MDNNIQLTRIVDNNYYSIAPNRFRYPVDKNHVIVKSVGQIFDKKNFSTMHLPMVLGNVNQQRFSKREDIRILDMPIKMIGSDYRIPSSLRRFRKVLQKMINFEHEINRDVDQYYAYLTIDQSFAFTGTTHRNSGCHVDGFQGSRIVNKLPINRSYIVYDQLPTVFYRQGFESSHLDEKTDNFFLSFDDQAVESKRVTFDPYQILLMHAYTVHRSEVASHHMYRTFFRLSFDTLQFDRLGNTHNPFFDYQWNMVTRDTQKSLRHKI